MIKYLRAFLRFYDWCVTVGWVARIPDLRALEAALVEWMEELHDAGVGPHVGNCALGAVKLMSPRSFAELIDARALLQDWNAVGQANHWPPLPYPLLFLVAAELLACGQIGEALALLLAFAGLLRISEVAGLRVQDVVFPKDARFWGVSFVVLALEHTKTGDDLSAEVRAAWLWPLLRRWVQQRAPQGRNARLFPGPGCASPSRCARSRTHCARPRECWVRVPLAPCGRCALPPQYGRAARRGPAAGALAPA